MAARCMRSPALSSDKRHAGESLFFWSRVRHVTAEPWNKLVEAELVGFVKSSDEGVGLLGVRGETRPVDGVRTLAEKEGRQLQALVEEALAGFANTMTNLALEPRW